MNILVIGCDQVGAALIRDLERIGHDISVVEKDPEQLKRLDAFDDYTFHGTALVGDPTDPDTLRRGGVENCDAVAAVTEEDSVNLMAAQLATSAVRRVSKLMASPHTTGTSNESARLRHNASCGSMMVTLWWWASRLWARYMPTLPPPAIQTFIALPRFPKRNVSKRRAYLASARNTACSVSTVGQTVSSS